MVGESSLAVYLNDGLVAATFKPSDVFSAVTTTSANTYSDSQRHHVRVTFDDGRLSIIVDDTDKTSVDSKTKS